MATDTRTAAPTQATDANFRLWITAVKNALVAAGLTQQADTGVINYATVTRPTIANSIKGFDIFKFSDTLHATKPVFLKVEYGSGTASTNPWIQFTVGTGTDGAGTITGPSTPANPQFTGMAAMTASTTVRTMLAAGVAAGGWFNFALWPGLHDAAQAGANVVICVERTRDATGAVTGDGLYVFYTNAGQTSGTGFYLDFNTNTCTSVSHVTTWNGVTGIAGADVYLAPFFPPGQPAAGKTFPPGLFGLCYFTTDITRDTNASVTLYGATHVFKCMGNWCNYVAMVSGSWSSNAAFAMRWE